MINPYTYSGIEPDFGMQLRKTTRKWLHYTVTFPTAHPTQYKENNTVRGEYLQPYGVSRAPLAIILHGIGDNSVIPGKLLARSLVKRGIACFILYLVFHSSRMPQTVKSRMPNLTPEEWFEGYRISVIDVRQVVDWAAGRAEINEEQVAVMGISFGGFISAITMGVDRRIGAGVFMVAGGNSEKIAQSSRFSSLRKKYRRTEAEYNHIQESYAQYLNEVAEKGFENVTPAQQSFLIDPLTFASALQERPVLMFNALWDEFIPRQATLDFWEACGKPPIAWFPATHSSIWLWYPSIRRKITRFLNSTFGLGDGHLT